jgi:hypothetical protein
MEITERKEDQDAENPRGNRSTPSKYWSRPMIHNQGKKLSLLKAVMDLPSKFTQALDRYRRTQHKNWNNNEINPRTHVNAQWCSRVSKYGR